MALMERSVEHFNEMFAEKNYLLKLYPDMNLFSLKIAKIKNGKPNSDIPSKYIFLIGAIVYLIKLLNRA